MDLTPGTSVDRYTIESALGEGGMAVVYKVRHKSLGSLHALKVLSLKMPSVRERLVQEGRVQASLRHPNIVAVTDIIEVDGAPGLIMEFIDGPDLESLLDRYRPTLDEAEALGVGIISGVLSAHRLGLIHRDLKPANVLMASTDAGPVPKVADFGLAKLLSGDGAAAMSRTRSGQAMGTPSYMAPEQIRNAKGVDKRADVFSLGAILYDLVCGHQAFAGGDLLTVFNAITTGNYTPPEVVVPDLPERMANAINGALKVNPEERIPDCETLLATWTGVTTRPGAMPITRSEASWSPALMSTLSMSGPGLAATRGATAAQRSLSSQTYDPSSIVPEEVTDPGRGAPPPRAAPQPTMGPTGMTQVPPGSILSLEPARRPPLVLGLGIGAVVVLALVAAVIGVGDGAAPAPPVPAAAPGPVLDPVAVSPSSVDGAGPSTTGVGAKLNPAGVDAPLASAAPSSALPAGSAGPVAPVPVGLSAPGAAASGGSPAAKAAPTKAGSTAAAPATQAAVTRPPVAAAGPATVPVGPPPVAPAPAAAPAAPVAAPTTATVTVRGDAQRVWLESASGRFPAGEVAPGTYRVTAFFDGVDPVVTGEITVAAGDRRELRCSSQLMVCR